MVKKILAIVLSLIIVGAFFVWVQAASADIAFDSSSNFPLTTVSSATFSHTTSGSDRILFVGVLVNANPGNNVTGATYAGVPMIQIGHHSFGSGNFGDNVFMLVNPALGTNNVVVSLDSAQNISAQSVSYTGARQTGQPDNFVSYGPGGPTTGIVTNSIVTITDNSWLVEWNQPRTPIVSSGGSVIRVSISGQLGSFLDSGVPQTPPGIHSISFSNNGVNDFFGGWLISIAPALPPPPAEGNLWQKRSFEGKGFIVTTDEITIAPTTERDFVLIKNPTASGKLHRVNELTVTLRSESQDTTIRIYKNPTVTTNGTALTVRNVRTSGNMPVSQVFSLPTISARGQLVAAYSRNADSLDRKLDLALYLEQGESFLITVEGTTKRNDYTLTSTFVEE